MKYTPEEIGELLKDKPHQPHYIAAMVRKAVEAERERCAKACEEFGGNGPGYIDDDWARMCAAAIRDNNTRVNASREEERKP